MKRLILTLAAIALIGAAHAQQQYQERDYIEINATASREVTPDEIYLKITLDQNDTKGKYTIDQLESQLYAALKKAGIDADKELKVSDMSSDIKNFLLKKNEGRTSKEYVLKVDNDHLMPVFRELDKAGINNVEIQSTRYSKYADVYNELLGEAVTKAKERADIMSKAAGVKALRVIYIQSYDNSVRYDTAPAAMNILYKPRAMSVEQAPTFEFNKTKIEATVTVRFGI